MERVSPIQTPLLSQLSYHICPESIEWRGRTRGGLSRDWVGGPANQNENFKTKTEWKHAPFQKRFESCYKRDVSFINYFQIIKQKSTRDKNKSKWINIKEKEKKYNWVGIGWLVISSQCLVPVTGVFLQTRPAPCPSEVPIDLYLGQDGSIYYPHYHQPYMQVEGKLLMIITLMDGQ